MTNHDFHDDDPGVRQRAFLADIVAKGAQKPQVDANGTPTGALKPAVYDDYGRFIRLVDDGTET